MCIKSQEDELDFEREHHGFYCEEEETDYNEDDVLEIDSYYREKWNNIKKSIWDNLNDD